MEKSVQCVSGYDGLTFFGIRHLSPAASHHLIKLLNRQKPKCVLIEGPTDANEMITQLSMRGVKPPIAILSYTSDMPVESVIYPFAEYSSEYQAVLWAVKNKREVRFIDLPTSVTLYNDSKEKEMLLNEGETNDGRIEYHTLVSKVYSDIAAIGEGIDYDDYWERNFEHNLSHDVYINTVKLHSNEIRQILEKEEETLHPYSHQRNKLRERFMRSQINKALTEYRAEDIVVITGAYHSEEIASGHLSPLSDEEFNSLNKRNVNLTLMPYTYYRLSMRCGYGAGNKAPYYFQTMWEYMQKGKLYEFPYGYISGVCRSLRDSGLNASTASVIESVRLSEALASMRSGSQPSMRDIQDAIISTIGEGDKSLVIKAFAEHDIGTGFGSLPEGVSKTPIQDDIDRQLKVLKLEKYKSTVAENITLDLRENTRVSSKQAAFIDLNRSIFFNRLEFLKINLPKRVSEHQQQSATWREIWQMQWTPEVEIAAVETSLKGETIEIASAYQFKETLENSTSISETAKLIKTAYNCNLSDCFILGAGLLQSLATDTESFKETAEAAWEMSVLLRYGDIRAESGADIGQLKPILKQLFIHASLLLNENAGCDDKYAREISVSINTMHNITQQHFDEIDDGVWVKELTSLAYRDDKNAILSGLSFSILLERGLVEDTKCAAEISRRLSVGIPPDIGAGWFEGLSKRNRYSLLSRTEIWRALDDYINTLDDTEFRRSLVFLRRSFSDFEPREKNSVAEILSDLWGLNSQDTAIILGTELNEEENQMLEGLNDFDFDF